jgi:outer membrane protein OmpA-like peptidoglycan-associated protein
MHHRLEGEKAMSGSLRKLGIGLVGGLALMAGAGMGVAAEPALEDKIRNALKPKGLTRSMAVTPAEAAKAEEQSKFVDKIRRTRQLTLGEREKVQEIVATTESKIDLEINFDYNSATINSRATPTVVSLGKVLSEPDMKGRVFLIAGHTDAKGGDSYNMKLSERRAEAIKAYLSTRFGIPAESLVSVGYGEEQLKNKADPNADENRRVQVVNMK